MKKDIHIKYALPVILVAMAVAVGGVYVYASTYYRVSSINPVTINEVGSSGSYLCRTITNPNPLDIFVPTKTGNEWSDFVNNVGGGFANVTSPAPNAPTDGTSAFQDSGGGNGFGHVISWSQPDLGIANCAGNTPTDTQYMVSGICSPYGNAIDAQIGTLGSAGPHPPNTGVWSANTWIDIGAANGYGGSDACSCRIQVRSRIGPINGVYSAWSPITSWTTGGSNGFSGCFKGNAS